MIPYTVYYNADGVSNKELVFARDSDSAGKKIIRKCLENGCGYCFITLVRIVAEGDFE